MALSSQGFEVGCTLTTDAERLLVESAVRLPSPGEIDRIYVTGLPERARRGDLSVLTLQKGLETVGVVCYRSIDRESELVYGCLKTDYCGQEQLFLDLIVGHLLGTGTSAIRCGFSWPESDRFTEAARTKGFKKVRRMSMVRDVNGELAGSYRPGQGISVLPWNPGHFDEVGALMCTAAEDFDRAVYPLFGSPEGCRTMLLSILQDRHGLFLPELSLVAQAGGKTVGFLLSSLIHDGSVLILDIAVEAGQRRRGIGRKLLENLLSKAALHGRRQVVLAVTMDNTPAIELYKKMGFREVSTFDQYVLEVRPEL